MLKINVKVGNDHTMPIPYGMQKLLEKFFSVFELCGELNFLLAKKLTGTNSLQGKISLNSVNPNSRTITVNAQPGGNDTRHELTVQIPSHIDYPDFEYKIRERIVELKEPVKKEVREEKIFQKCLKLFCALDGRLRNGINKRKLHNGDYKAIKYTTFESLYGSILRHAITFKFLTPEGQKGNTTYAWTPYFLAKKDEHEEAYPPDFQKEVKKPEVTEKSTDNVVNLSSMSEEELTDLYCNSDERLKSIDKTLAELRQERYQLTILIPKILDLIDGIKTERNEKIAKAIEAILPLTDKLSDEDLLKIFRR